MIWEIECEECGSTDIDIHPVKAGWMCCECGESITMSSVEGMLEVFESTVRIAQKGGHC